MGVETGDRLGERFADPSLSGGDDGDDPPVAEFRRDAVKRTFVSRWRNLCNVDKCMTYSFSQINYFWINDRFWYFFFKCNGQTG